MKLVKVYSAANTTEAYLIRGLLNQSSIESEIQGENLTIAAGGLPADVYQVDVFVDDSKYSEALEVILNYEQILHKPAKDGESWECEGCEKINPDTFEICWNCQSNRLTVA